MGRFVDILVLAWVMALRLAYADDSEGVILSLAPFNVTLDVTSPQLIWKPSRNASFGTQYPPFDKVWAVTYHRGPIYTFEAHTTATGASVELLFAGTRLVYHLIAEGISTAYVDGNVVPFRYQDGVGIIEAEYGWHSAILVVPPGGDLTIYNVVVETGFLTTGLSEDVDTPTVMDSWSAGRTPPYNVGPSDAQYIDPFFNNCSAGVSARKILDHLSNEWYGTVACSDTFTFDLPPNVTFLRMDGPVYTDLNTDSSPYLIALDPPPPLGPRTYIHSGDAGVGEWRLVLFFATLDPTAQYQMKIEALSEEYFIEIQNMSLWTLPNTPVAEKIWPITANINTESNGSTNGTEDSGGPDDLTGEKDEHHTKVNLSVLIGGVVGGVAVGALLLVGVFYLYKRWSKGRPRGQMDDAEFVVDESAASAIPYTTDLSASDAYRNMAPLGDPNPSTPGAPGSPDTSGAVFFATGAPKATRQVPSQPQRRVEIRQESDQGRVRHSIPPEEVEYQVVPPSYDPAWADERDDNDNTFQNAPTQPSGSTDFAPMPVTIPSTTDAVLGPNLPAEQPASTFDPMAPGIIDTKPCTK